MRKDKNHTEGPITEMTDDDNDDDDDNNNGRINGELYQLIKNKTAFEKNY